MHGGFAISRLVNDGKEEEEEEEEREAYDDDDVSLSTRYRVLDDELNR